MFKIKKVKQLKVLSFHKSRSNNQDKIVIKNYNLIKKINNKKYKFVSHNLQISKKKNNKC